VAAIAALLFTSLIAEELFWNNPAEASRKSAPLPDQHAPAAVNAGGVVPPQNAFANTVRPTVELTGAADVPAISSLTNAASPLVVEQPEKKQPQRLLELTDNGWVFNGTAKKKKTKKLNRLFPPALSTSPVSKWCWPMCTTAAAI
jgi:hypothetical protein